MLLRALCVALVAILLPYISIFYLHALGPTPLGYVNKLFPPSPFVLRLNPSPTDLPFSQVLRDHYQTFRDEFFAQRAQVSRPRANFYSKEFPGALRNETDLDGWSTTYLRLGTADTCLTKYFPRTMHVLDDLIGKQLGVRVHSIFFSLLAEGKDWIAPHCGQLAGLWRAITVLSGEKREGAESLAVQYGYEDDAMCLTRFSKDCPSDLFDAIDKKKNAQDAVPAKIKAAYYNVGDVFLFNDFTCHAVRNFAKGERLVMVVNVDRHDMNPVSNTLVAWGSWVFSQKTLSVFREKSLPLCKGIEEMMEKGGAT